MVGRGFSLKGAIAQAIALVFAAGAVVSAAMPTTAAAQESLPSFELLADVNPGLSQFPGLNINEMTSFNGKLYMAATGELHLGYELYEYDPATDQLRLVSDIRPGQSSSFPSEFQEYDGKLYFRAGRYVEGQELFVFDPVENSVELVVDLTPQDFQNTSPNSFVVFDNKLYFNGVDSTNTPKVFQYDSATGETIAMTGPTSWSGLVATGSGLWMVLTGAETDPNTNEKYFLYRHTAGSAGFTRVDIPAPTAIGSANFYSPRAIKGQDGVIVALPYSPVGGAVLFDTVQQTVTVAPPLAGTFNNRNVVLSDGRFWWFDYASGGSGFSLQSIAAGETTLTEHPSSTAFNYVSQLYAASSGLYFDPDIPNFGVEPWRYVPGSNTFQALGDLLPGAQASYPRWFTELNGVVYAGAELPDTGNELIAIGGTDTEFALVAELGSAANSGGAQNAVASGRDVFFIGVTGDQPQAGSEPIVEGVETVERAETLEREQIQDAGLGPDTREIYRVNVDTRVVTKMTTFSSATEAPFYSQLHTLGDYVIFAVNFAESFGYYAMHKATGALTEITIPAGFIPGSSQDFGAEGVLLQLVDPGTFRREYYFIKPDLSLVTFDSITVGIDVIEVGRVVPFNGYLYFSAVDAFTSGSGVYRYEPSTGIVERAFDATALGLATADSSYSSFVIDVAADRLIFNAAGSGNFGPYMLTTTGDVLPFVDVPNPVYDVVAQDQKLIFTDFSAGVVIYDLTTDTFSTASYTPAQLDPTYFAEDIVIFEGQVLVKGYNQTNGSGELFALNLTDNSFTPYVSTMPGAASMDIGPLLQLSDQIVAPAFRDDVGYELFTLISNRAPTISGTPATTVAQGDSYSFTPTGSDADNDPFSYVIENKPSWASFSTVTGALIGTPGNSDVGTYSNISIGITDGKATSNLPAFSITVTNVNDAPTISGAPETLSVLQDQVWSFTPTIADVDVGDQLNLSLNAAAPAWLSVNGGTISGSPSNSDVGVTGSIVVTVTDAAGASASLPGFSITVVNVNDAPTIGGTPQLQVNQGVLYEFQALGADIDLGDELMYTVLGEPRWLSFNRSSGLLSGTPSNDDVGQHGPITIVVSDLAGATAVLPEFTITVNNVNDAPTISGTPDLRVDQDQPYYFKPTADDIDVGAQLTFSLSPAAPGWLSFSTASGILDGTPSNADVGSYGPFTLSVSDGELSAALPAFTITVDNVNDAPTISGTPGGTATQGQQYSFKPTATDIDEGDQLTFSVSGNPTWLSINSSDGTLSGTPANADVGVTSNIVLTVTDSAQASAALNFSLTVANVNDAPVITNTPLLSIKDGEAYSFVPQVSDPDTAVDPEESFSFSITNQPTWASFDTSTGALTGTPAAGDIAEWAGITITVTDREGLTDSVGPFTITVTESNQDPIAVDDAYTVDTDSFDSSRVFPIFANDFDPEGQSITIVKFGKKSGPGIGALSYAVVDGKVAVTGMTISVPSGYIGEVVYEYIIKDRQNARSDAATVTFTFIGSPGITLTPPADVIINATGALTKVDQSQLGTATATLLDSPIGVGVIKPQDSDVYLSGVHTFTWVAGMARNEVSKPQTVTIIPQVTLGQDLKVEANTGVGVTVPVTLSGPAPSYPYTVRLLVNGNAREVVFESGTVANLSLPGLADSESYEISIVATENIGANGSITVSPLNPGPPKTVSGRTSNPTPIPGDQVPIIVPSNSDSPVIQATDTLRAVLMPASGGADIDPGEVILTVSANSIQVTVTVPLTTPSGVYLVAVVATRDGRETAVIVTIVVRRARVSAADESIMAFEYNPDDEDLSRELDQNDNGIVDYEEGRWDDNGNGIPAYLDRAFNSHDIWADGAYATTLQDLHFIGYPSLDEDVSSIRVATTPDAMGDFSLVGMNAFTQAGMDISSYRFYGEFYRFLLLQLVTVGDQAPVVLPLDEPIGAGAEFLLWQDGAWRAFAEGAGGALYSASSVYGACPTAGSAAWQPGLNQGHWCVQLVITDGGVNDVDGAADGAIEVFGGVAIDSTGNVAPVAVADTAVAIWRGTASLLPLANDTDADGDSLSIVSASADIGTVTVNAARTGIQFVSPGDFAGTANITYVVTDNNGGMAVGTATVTVLENRAPVLGADSAATVSGRPVSVNVLANDADPDGDVLSLTGASLASGSGSVSYSGSSVSFTPAASFVGVATVSYTVSDGRGGSATGTLTVQVRQPVEVIEVRPATGSFWWFLTVGGLLLAFRRRNC